MFWKTGMLRMNFTWCVAAMTEISGMRGSTTASIACLNTSEQHRDSHSICIPIFHIPFLPDLCHNCSCTPACTIFQPKIK